jgi:FG-GAP-like repeat/FG-GAP repeat
MMRRLLVGLVIGAALVGLLGLGAAQAGAAGFTPALGSPFATGGASPFFVAVGDFNGDNKPDVAVGNGGSANVSVLLGDGSGGLSPAPGSPFASGVFGPESVAVGDFNGDNKPDVAVANGNGTVSVLLGDGSGGLSPAPGSPFASGGSFPEGVAVADFNGDNKPDVSVANDGSDTVSVLLGDASGGLSPAPGSPFASGGSQPFGVAAGDFNGDNKPDVALGNAGSDTVAVLLGDGSGGLSPAPRSPFASGGITPTGVAVGDFNGDNKPDVAVSNENSDNLSVLLGNGSGGLRPAGGSPFATQGSSPFGVAVGDFNSDNSPDVAVANYRSNNVSVLLNRRCPARRSGSCGCGCR